MVGKIEEINLRAVSIFTTAQLTAVPPYYSVDTSVDSVDSTMATPGVIKKQILKVAGGYACACNNNKIYKKKSH